MGLDYPSMPAGCLLPYGGPVTPNGWLLADGSAISRTTYSALFAALSPALGAFTITIAAPGVATLTAHGLQTGDQVYLTTTGALPTGLTANTLYYARRIDANTFNLSTTRANAYAGTYITTTGSQSGVHTINHCPHGLGDGTTTFNVPDMRGRVPAGNDAMGGSVASRLTLSTTQGAYGNPGAVGGAQAHTLITAELAAHKHLLVATETIGTAGLNNANQIGYARNTGNDFSYGMDNGGSALAADKGLSSATGSDTAHNNLQPTLVINYIVKT